MSEVSLTGKDRTVIIPQVGDGVLPALATMNRGHHLIEQLESLVIKPQFGETNHEHRESSTLTDYARGFASLNIPGLISHLRGGVPNEPFLAADIGGCYGTAASDLEKAGCDRCFVIDPCDHRTASGSALPSNRFILRGAESMEGIPDDCFQFIVSFNALTYTNDLSKALSEICRVLRPEGVALVDIEWWAQGKDFETLRSLTLPADIRMQLITSNRQRDAILTIPLDKALDQVGSNGGDKGIMLAMMLGSGFIIEKAPQLS